MGQETICGSRSTVVSLAATAGARGAAGQGPEAEQGRMAMAPGMGQGREGILLEGQQGLHRLQGMPEQVMRSAPGIP